MKKEKTARERIQDAARAHRVGFSHPDAEKCFPIKLDARNKKLEFVYCTCMNTSKAFIIMWGVKNLGFGEITFSHVLGGRVKVESEGMGNEFVVEVLKELLKRGLQEA